MVTGPLELPVSPLPSLSTEDFDALRAQLQLSGADVEALTRAIKSEDMISQVEHLLAELPEASRQLLSQLREA